MIEIFFICQTKKSLDLQSYLLINFSCNSWMSNICAKKYSSFFRRKKNSGFYRVINFCPNFHASNSWMRDGFAKIYSSFVTRKKPRGLHNYQIFTFSCAQKNILLFLEETKSFYRIIYLTFSCNFQLSELTLCETNP